MFDFCKITSFFICRLVSISYSFSFLIAIDLRLSYWIFYSTFSLWNSYCLWILSTVFFLSCLFKSSCSFLIKKLLPFMAIVYSTLSSRSLRLFSMLIFLFISCSRMFIWTCCLYSFLLASICFYYSAFFWFSYSSWASRRFAISCCCRNICFCFSICKSFWIFTCCICWAFSKAAYCRAFCCSFLLISNSFLWWSACLSFSMNFLFYSARSCSSRLRASYIFCSFCNLFS